jgi:hypothetical protein
MVVVAPAARQLHADGHLEGAMDRALIAAIIVLTSILAVRLVFPETTRTAPTLWAALADPATPVHRPDERTLNWPEPSDCARYWSAEPYHPLCDEFAPPKLVWLAP